MESPFFSVPAPSPHPSSELQLSADLDLTPEKPQPSVRRRRAAQGTRRKEDKSNSHGYQPEPSSVDCPSNLTAPSISTLAVPTLNSTARLYHRLQSLKQQRQQQQRPASAATAPTDTRESFSPSPSPSPPPQASCSPVTSVRVFPSAGLTNCEGAGLSRHVKELNVPRNVSRYSDLVSVDVSDESFQELTGKNRKAGGRRMTGKGGGTSEEPQIMDFFSPDMEWEDAEWGLFGGAGEADVLEPVYAPADSVFLLCQYTHAAYT